MILNKLNNSSNLATWLNLLIKSFSGLVLIPLINIKYNESELSVWLKIQAFWGFLLIFELGLNQLLTRLYAYNIEKKNKSKVKEIFKASKQTYLLLNFILLIFVIPINFYLNSNNKNVELNFLLISIMIFVFSNSYIYSNVYTSLLQGHNKVFLAQKLQAKYALVSFLSAFIMIISNSNIIYVILLFYFPYFLYFVHVRKVVNKYYDYKLSFDFKINTFLLKDVWKTGLGLFLSQGTIFITILYVIENFKLEVSTLFMIYIQYHKAISAFSQVPLYSKIPIYSKMYASKKIEELNTYFTKNMIKSLSLIFFIVILLFITRFTKFGETIFNTNHGLDLQLLISMYYIIQRLNSSLLQFYSVTNEVIWHKMNSVNLVGLSIVIFTHFYYGVLDIELLVLVGICVELFLFFPIIKIYLRSFCLNIKWHFDYLFILFSTFCVGLLYVVF